MEQELLSDEAELLEAKTFFTAFSDPDCIPILAKVRLIITSKIP
jgi:hypothetical protein